MAQDGTTQQLPQIDLARCTGCGRCAQLCPTSAVAVVGTHAVIVDPQACTYCEICESYCPTEAIGRPFTVVFAADQRGTPLQATDAIERNET